MSESQTAETTDAQDETSDDVLDEWLEVGNRFKWLTGAPGEAEILEIGIDEDLKPQITVETHWSYGTVEKDTVTPEDVAEALNEGRLERLDD